MAVNGEGIVMGVGIVGVAPECIEREFISVILEGGEAASSFSAVVAKVAVVIAGEGGVTGVGGKGWS